MIKVLEEGTPKIYYHKCVHCRSKLLYQYKDTNPYGEGSCPKFTIKCPICAYEQIVMFREYEDKLTMEEPS